MDKVICNWIWRMGGWRSKIERKIQWCVGRPWNGTMWTTCRMLKEHAIYYMKPDMFRCCEGRRELSMWTEGTDGITGEWGESWEQGMEEERAWSTLYSCTEMSLTKTEPCIMAVGRVMVQWRSWKTVAWIVKARRKMVSWEWSCHFIGYEARWQMMEAFEPTARS